MAKSKDKDKEKDVEEKEKPAKSVDIIKEMNKKYGDGVFKTAKAFNDEDIQVIPFSPSLDLAVGGIPEGSWVILAGPPKKGKTMSALHFAAKCQRPEYGSRKVFYLNIEGRLKKMNLNGITGLEPDKITIVGSTEDKIMSAQDYLTAAENILMSEKRAVMIIDSYGALCHEKEIAEGIGTSTRGGGAMLLAQFTRQMSNVVPVKKSIIIGITQLQANTSGYGKNIMEKGGNAIQYQGDVKLVIKSSEEWMEDGKRIGQIVHWISEFSALKGFPPGNTATSYLRYNHGIDEAMEMIALAIEIGLIEQGGAWYELKFLGKDEKIQGVAKVYKMINENPDIAKKLREKLNESLGIGQ